MPFRQAAQRDPDAEKFSLGPRLTGAAIRLHRNKLAAALANKLARIAWSVLRHNKRFDEALAV